MGRNTGGHLWAERYDRDLTDIFAVQDEVTQHIVSALSVQLTRDEQKRVVKKGTDNLEAYDTVEGLPKTRLRCVALDMKGQITKDARNETV